MKSTFDAFEKNTQQDADSNHFDALIQGYVDYLNWDGQEEVLLIEEFLEEYFEDYSDEILLKVLTALFERGIEAGNNGAGEEILRFPNGTLYDPSATPLQKAQMTWNAFKETKALFPEDPNCPNNRVMLQFGIVLWSKDVFKKACRRKFNPTDYEMSEEVRKSVEARVLELQKQCELGDSKAYFSLGFMYDDGDGVKKDYQKALELYTKACELGSGEACLNLGVMHDEGKGVKQDYQKAKEFYERACELGNAAGCYCLGRLYEKGNENEQDHQKATENYEKACELGNDLGCYNLGSMYEQGKGVERDFAKAIEFYREVCELGDQKGCENLQRCLKELEEREKKKQINREEQRNKS